jgi:formamidopyrimidine-DNA glycosylase
MPELPELDVLTENLRVQLTGARVRSVRVVSVAALKTFDPPLDALAGRTIVGAGRRAKYVWIEVGGSGGLASEAGATAPRPEAGPSVAPPWDPGSGGLANEAGATAPGPPSRAERSPPVDSGGLDLVMHLSLGGRLTLGAKPASRKVAVLAVELEDGRVLSMTEVSTQRRAAVWLVEKLDQVPGLAALGPEPLDPDFTVERLGEILAGGGHTLKGMLTDQRGMSGVGNAWSDEVLHRARLSPFARPERLGEQEVARLHGALLEVLTEARGSLAEQVGGRIEIPKASERLFAVHGRAGAAFFVCGDTIRSVWMGERETSYCPTCQTGGRVLADRRRSKFLR